MSSIATPSLSFSAVGSACQAYRPSRTRTASSARKTGEVTRAAAQERNKPYHTYPHPASLKDQNFGLFRRAAAPLSQQCDGGALGRSFRRGPTRPCGISTVMLPCCCASDGEGSSKNAKVKASSLTLCAQHFPEEVLQLSLANSVSFQESLCLPSGHLCGRSVCIHDPDA